MVADWNSRYLADSSDCRLHRPVFLALAHLRDPSLWTRSPLASSISSRTFTTGSRIRRRTLWTPSANLVTGDTLRVFSPFPMTLRVILLIANLRASVVRLTPRWPTQPWFSPPSGDDCGSPQVASSLPSSPSRSEGGSAPAPHETHPTSLRRVGFGVPVADSDFPRATRDPFFLGLDPGIDRHLDQPGVSGFLGVINDRLIPFRRLGL